ncbi:AAA family ATPase [Brevibacillus sp. FSL K6-2834]|uniref:AAA family ATPase n=1 Tax=Brevibacillus sp. FSL K6-2834 TaxID=2954680 RepID=UPI0031584ED2
MIKKIKYIKDFGVFKDFTWHSGLSEFKNFNLIYAWNYSGKTTLSRIFQSFENRKIHDDFLVGRYELEISDGSSVGVNDLANPILNIRVFNSDFISKQLKWENFDGIDPIFILGEENIELQRQLEELKKDIEKVKKNYHVNCILQLKNAEFGGQFMQNTANINTKEFRKTSCWIEHGAVGSFLR